MSCGHLWPTITISPLPAFNDIYILHPSGKACGWASSSVPWGAIAEDTSTYISNRYLPSHVSFKEPTRFNNNEVTEILEWWKGRQDTNPADIFKFKMWIKSDGSTQPAVSKPNEPSTKSLGKRRHTGKYILTGSRGSY